MRFRFFNLAYCCLVFACPPVACAADSSIASPVMAAQVRQPQVTNGRSTSPGQYPFLTAVMSGRRALIQLSGQSLDAYYFAGGLQQQFSGAVVDCGLSLDRCAAAEGKICSIVLDFPGQGVPALSPAQQLSNCSEAGGIGAIFRPNPTGVGELTLAGTEPQIPAVYIYNQTGYQILARAMLTSSQFQASVGSGFPDTILCGGTYLGGSWVLTAGHCVVDDSGDQRRIVNPEELVANVGAYRLGSDNEFVQRVTEVILFDYHTRGPWSKNDYALLRLDSVPRRGVPVSLISRDELNSMAAAASPALVLGWGSTSVREPLAAISAGSGTSATPLSAVLMLHSVDACRSLWGDFFRLNNLVSAGLEINDNHVCASNVEQHKDTCQGDSGGPMLVESDGELKLAGVTSFGLGCGSSNSVPGVYSSVPSFSQQIISTTGLSGLGSPDRGFTGQSSADSFSANTSFGSGSFSLLTMWFLLLVYSAAVRCRKGVR